MSPEEVRALVTLDTLWRDRVAALWQELMHIAVWGDLKSAQVGGVPRLRKRVLDLGEKWRSVFNSRDWLPQPREQIKNALASAANLRDSLLLLERAAQELEGGEERERFGTVLIALHREAVGPLRDRENQWAFALDAVNQAALDREHPEEE